jgi:hypothetical protein
VGSVNGYRATYTIWWPQTVLVTFGDGAGLFAVSLGIGLVDGAQVVPAALLGQEVWRVSRSSIARTIQ